MKFGHMDGMHCIIDGTSVLVKIKSVALYNCQTVYVDVLCIIVFFSHKFSFFDTFLFLKKFIHTYVITNFFYRCRCQLS